MLSRAEVPRSPTPLRAAILLMTVSLFGCDHATKLAAESTLSGGRTVNVVNGLLELRYAPNPDTAFSLLGHLGIARPPSLLLAASAIALVGVVAAWITARKRASRTQHIGFGLVLAGALGNVVDRAVRGYVVDFIHLTRWPVFNVADIAVVAGMLLLVMATLRKREAPPI
jgi:signal peptidase II